MGGRDGTARGRPARSGAATAPARSARSLRGCSRSHRDLHLGDEVLVTFGEIGTRQPQGARIPRRELDEDFAQGTGRDVGGPLTFLCYSFGSPNWVQLGLSGQSCYTPRLGSMKAVMGSEARASAWT